MAKNQVAWKALNFTFNYNALIMNDIYSVFFNLEIMDKIADKMTNCGNLVGAAAEVAASGITSVGINTLTKILGFSFNTNVEIPLLEYEYSQHPYINRAMLTYAAIKQDCEFTIGVNSVITSLSPFITKFATIQAYTKGLEYYTDRGGTFSVLTPSGVINPCVLVRWAALESEDPSAKYEMTLRKINVAGIKNNKSLSAQIANAISGAIVRKVI